MELAIDSFASTGKGVATILVDGFRRPVFVDGAIPGDICDVEFTKKHKKYAEASIVKLIKPSIHRREPSCSSFGTCGACDWLNVDYAFQIESKKQILSFLFSKLNLSPEINILACDQNTHYRDKVRIQFKDGFASFYERKSNNLVQPESCSIINDSFNDFFNKKTSFDDGEKTFIFDYETKKPLFDDASRAYYFYKDIKFEFGLKSFIQSNLKQNIKLIDLITSLVSEGSILELYCGMGNFTLPLANNSCDVLAVEGNPRAVDSLKNNLLINDISSVKPICMDVREFLKTQSTFFDFILLDPPRVGVDDIPSLEKLSLLTNNIVYIACDPNSLIKDLKTLLPLGFKLENVYLVDLFPQTHHFETVVVLSK